MSTGRGSPASCSSMEASDSKQGPEHLIVLVHGIMARTGPSGWTYGEAMLKKRLGDDFFIYEEMTRGLQRVGWKKVDVNFHASLWPYSAHNNMHVKNEWLHNAHVGLNTTKFLRSHPMSTGRGCPMLRSPMEASDSNQGPEHLIVLVHGIMASPSDWTYGEAVLKKRLGDNFFIYEETILGLQRVGWKKIDVNFHASLLPYSAHNNMHVKNEWLHNAGSGVIAHVADSMKQTCLPSSLW